MFCPYCGFQNDDEDLFCVSCGKRIAGLDGTAGTPVAQPGPVEPAPQNAQPPQAAPAPMPATAPAAQQTPPPAAEQPVVPPTPLTAPAPASPKKSKKKLGIILAIVAVVVALAIAGCAYYFLKVVPEAEQARQPVPVSFTLDVPGYDSSTDSPIPLHVTGTDREGNAVSTDIYINGYGEGASLKPGAYEASVVASPLMASGNYYSVPTVTQNFEVSRDGISGSPTFSFNLVSDYTTITDDQISASYNAALASGMTQSSANELRDLLVSKRDKALANANTTSSTASGLSSSSSSETTWYVCASDFVTLRSGTSTSASAITRIYSREPVTYHGDAGNGFSRVSYNGMTGYVLTKFISPNPNAPLNYDSV